MQLKKMFFTTFVMCAGLLCVSADASLVYAQSAACTNRTFSIGALDSRFGISSTTLLVDIQSAEHSWEDAAHKNIFTYVPTGGAITVELIYDSRQASTVAIRAREEKLKAIKVVFTALQSAFQKVADETQVSMVQNADRFSAYVQDLNTFNADVARINARGGASQDEADSLQQRKSALEQKFAESKVIETQLNNRVASLNALSVSFNKIADILNSFVKQHNDTLAGLGEFEEGYYKREGSVESIGIYSFADDSQLIRVLAHEMGHALGMMHVADPEAIMYEVNKGTSLVPTSADLAALVSVCN